MADQIASLYAKIGVDASGFNRGLDSAQGRLNGFASMAQKLGGMVGTAVKVAGAASAIAVAGIGVAVSKTGIEFNAMQEQAEIAFTTMLGSAEKAQDFLGKMQDFARTTPFEYPGLLTASKRMVALGFAADDVLPMLTNIGDAIAGLGGDQQTLDRVVTALGQMKAKGKVQAEEMMQLTENGIAAWDMLAKKLNVDVATAMDMVTNRQVDAAVGIEAINEGMAAKFGGMMEKQSHTWTGMISNLKDSFGILSGRVMKPFFKAVEKGLGWLVDFTSSDAFVKGIDRFASRITTAFNDFFAMLDNGEGVLGAFLTFIGDLLPKNLLPAWTVFATGFYKLAMGIGEQLKWLANIFSMMFAVITSENATWGEKMLAIWDMLYTVGLKIWQSLLDGIVKLVPEWLARLVEWGQALWQWIVDNTPKALAKLGEWAAALWGWLVDNLPTWLSNLWDWAVGLWQWIVEVTPIAVAQLVEWGKQLWGWLTTNFPTWVAALAEWGAAAWRWLADVIPDVVTQIGNWGTAVLYWLYNNSPAWQAELTRWGTAAWQWIADALPGVIIQLGQWGMNVIGWFTENLPVFINVVLSWATWLVKWIGDALPLAINALASFVQGLRGEGDNTGANAIGQMVRGWAAQLWKWIVVDSLPMVAPAFQQFVAAVVEAAGKILPALMTLATELGKTLWSWVVEAAPIVYAKLQEWGGVVDGWLAGMGLDFLSWRDIVVGVAAVFLTHFAPSIMGAITSVIGGLSSLGVAWGPMLAIFAAAVAASALLRTAWENDWGGIQEKTGAALEYIQSRFGPLGATIRDFGVEALTEIGKWAIGMDTDFTATNAIIDEAKRTFSGLWQDFKTQFPETAGVVESAWQTVSTATQTSVDYAVEKTQGLRDTIKEFGVQSLEEIVKWATGQDTEFTATTKIWNSFKDTVNSVKDDFIKNVVPPMTEWFVTTFPNAADSTVIALGILQTSWSDTMKVLRGDLSETDRDFSNFFASLQVLLDTGLGLAIVKVSTFVANFALSIAALSAAVKGDWDGMWYAIGKIQGNYQIEQEQELKFRLAQWATIITAGGEEIPKGFKQGLDKTKGTATSGMSDFANDVSGAFTRPLMINSPSRLFEGYGRNVVEGFDEGFSARWRTFANSASHTVSGWVSWFRSVFGIHSPSTLFAGYGDDIVTGLANGINAGADKVYAALGAVTDTVNGMYANISTAGNGLGIVAGRDVVSSAVLLEQAVGAAKASEVYKQIQALASDANFALRQYGITDSSILQKTFDLSNASQVGSNTSIGTLMGLIDSVIQQLNNTGASLSTGTAVRAGLTELGDLLTVLTQGGTGADTGVTPPASSGGFSSTGEQKVIDLLTMIVDALTKNGSLNHQDLGVIRAYLSNPNGYGQLVTNTAGLTP